MKIDKKIEKAFYGANLDPVGYSNFFNDY